jgi:tetratricopeptide (TPR) repeat protein
VNSNEASRTPQPVDGVDMRRLPIGPEEAFILSRIDGRTSETDIVAETGLEPGRVRKSLERLAELGAIAFGPAPEPLPPPPGAGHHAAARPARFIERPAVEARPADGVDQQHPAAALYDPADLDEAVDLDLQRKRRILDTYYRLEGLNHYELFGLDSSADKKAIKDAYYREVTIFHPDRYFGKNLGSFKPKLEKVFNRLTEAHETLTRKRSREEYDEYLKRQRKNETEERMLADERAHAAELERIKRAIEEEARLAERVSHSTPPPFDAAARPSTPARPSDPDARRRALARKLGRPSGRMAKVSSNPPTSAPVSRESVAEDLKRRYEQRLSSLKTRQVERYVEAADKALLENNPVSAANALRIAVSLAPEDGALQARLDDIQARANSELAQSYLDQAQYEERSGRLAEAALSYERAARGKPNARLFERAAHCLVESQGDFKKASELAKRAVSMAPEEASLRVTLARVYLAAGMKQSALSEFERAFTLAPSDDTIRTWIRRIKRGEV